MTTDYIIALLMIIVIASIILNISLFIRGNHYENLWVSLKDKYMENKYNERIDELRESKEKLALNKREYENCLTLIDFDNINIFSIERSNNKTTIGYWADEMGKCDTKEWVLDIPVDIHNELVKAYKKYTSKDICIIGEKHEYYKK